MHCANESARQHQVGHAEQREQLGVVLRQAAIAGLAMFEQALHDMETVLDFCRGRAGIKVEMTHKRCGYIKRPPYVNCDISS